MSLPPFTFTPFIRGLDEVDATDAPALRNAAEGWHLDYKRDVPDTKSAAKSISSFANTYGGWVIYGVDAPAGGARIRSGSLEFQRQMFPVYWRCSSGPPARRSHRARSTPLM